MNTEFTNAMGQPITVSPTASGWAELLYAAWEELDEDEDDGSYEVSSFGADECSSEEGSKPAIIAENSVQIIQELQDMYGRSNRIADEIYDFVYNNTVSDDVCFDDSPYNPE